MAEIELTIEVMGKTFANLKEDDLQKIYPILNFFWLRNDNRIFAHSYGYTFQLSPWSNKLSQKNAGY